MLISESNDNEVSGPSCPYFVNYAFSFHPAIITSAHVDTAVDNTVAPGGLIVKYLHCNLLHAGWLMFTAGRVTSATISSKLQKPK